MQQKTEAMVQNTIAVAAKVAVETAVKATVVAAENIREMVEKVTENPPVSEQKKSENKALTSVKDALKKEEATKTSAVDRNVTGMYNIGIGSSLYGGSIGLNGVLFGGIMGPLGVGTLDSRGKIASYYTQEKTAKAGNRDYVTWKSGQKEYQVTSADLHLMLDVMGMIPGWGDLADLANAAMYLKEGNVKEAGNIVLSVITNTDNIKTLNKFRKQLNLAYETADNLEELGDGYKAAKKISKEVKEELKEEAAEKAGKKVIKESDASTLSGQWKSVNENMSDFSRAYQKQITGQEGMAWVQNGVKFDGMKDGVLLDAKGKYAQFIDKNTGEFYEWFSGKDSLIAEARRQIDASEGAKIQWYFAEEESLDVVQDLLMDKGITEIELIFKAPK